MWMSALGAENVGFFEICDVSAQTRREGGSIFCEFVRTSFMDGP